MSGATDAVHLRIAVVRALFNRPVTDGLLEGAKRTLKEVGVTDVTVVEVPGSFDIPLVAMRLATLGYDAIVAIGAVIEGETDHYEHVAHRASEGLMRVMLDTGVPVTFGILTVRDKEHAFARSGVDDHNKGSEAASAAVELALLLRGLGS